MPEVRAQCGVPCVLGGTCAPCTLQFQGKRCQVAGSAAMCLVAWECRNVPGSFRCCSVRTCVARYVHAQWEYFVSASIIDTLHNALGSLSTILFYRLQPASHTPVCLPHSRSSAARCTIGHRSSVAACDCVGVRERGMQIKSTWGTPQQPLHVCVPHVGPP